MNGLYIDKQRTLAGKFSTRGKGLHRRGSGSTVTSHPADENTGDRTRKINLPGKPTTDARATNVIDTNRGAILMANGDQTGTVLVFMDSHLWDGDSFETFEKVKTSIHIIFTPACDEYALRISEVNSINYLPQPIGHEDLEDALNKLCHISDTPILSTDLISKIVKFILQEKEQKYKRAFLIPQKDKLIPVSADNIAYIFSRYKMAEIYCFNGQKHILDISLTGMMKQLDPHEFYHANRQFIVAHSAIKDMSVWFQGKLAINLSVPTKDRIIVSRTNSNDFKDWFLKNSK